MIVAPDANVCINPASHPSARSTAKPSWRCTATVSETRENGWESCWRFWLDIGFWDGDLPG